MEAPDLVEEVLDLATSDPLHVELAQPWRYSGEE
jgi:hypothetical protein